MEGLVAAATKALEADSSQDDEDESLPMKQAARRTFSGQHSGRRHMDTVLDDDVPLSQSSIESGGTIPPPVVNWSRPKKPKGIVDSIPSFPKGKVGRDAYRNLHDTMAKAIQTNAATALDIHETLVDKCALGKKQELALKEAQKKIVSLRKKKLVQPVASSLSSAKDKQIWVLEKQNMQLQIDNAKEKSRSQEKLAKEYKKEADDTKKELSQVNKDLSKEKDKSADLRRHLDKTLVEVKELSDSKKKLEHKLKKYEDAEFQQQKYEDRLAARGAAKQKERAEKDSRRNQQFSRAAMNAGGYHASSRDLPKIRQYLRSDDDESSIDVRETQRRRKRSRKMRRKYKKKGQKKQCESSSSSYSLSSSSESDSSSSEEEKRKKKKKKNKNKKTKGPYKQNKAGDADDISRHHSPKSAASSSPKLPPKSRRVSVEQHAGLRTPQKPVNSQESPNHHGELFVESGNESERGSCDTNERNEFPMGQPSPQT